MTKEVDIQENMDLQAEVYADKYRDQVDAYESGSVRSIIQESIQAAEIVALGQQLDQFTNYTNYVQENQGNLASLGQIPQVALDVITASVGSSILPLVSSIQPIAEEHSIVYYKQIKASQNSGGYTKGEVIASPLARDNLGDGSLGSQRRNEIVATTASGTLEYTGNLATTPARPYTIEVMIGNLGFGKDDGQGKLLGFGFQGTINYETGAYVIQLKEDPLTANADILVIYDVDTDSRESLDKIEGSLISKDIKAEVWALAADVGSLASFAFQQRFGRSAIEEVAADLTNEITRVLNTQAIMRILGIAQGNTNWDAAAPSGVSYAEHKLTFIDAMASAESVMHQNSGVSAINRILAGRTSAAKLRGMPGFVPAAVAPTTSVGLYGTYEGIPVIRATGVIPDNELIMLANPDNYFNAPLAYAPFMPLMMTNTVQSPNNPLRQTQAAAVWAGMKTLNENLVTKLTIQN